MIGNLTVKLLKLINEPESAIHQLEIFTLTTKTRNMLFIDIVLTATDEKRNLYCTNCFFFFASDHRPCFMYKRILSK